MKFNAVDLFSGAGGLTEGLKQAGFAVDASVEICPLASETYKMNHPEVNVRNENIKEIEPESLGLDKLDLLAGCPPCQGFSTLTTRNGSTSVSDHRKDLIFEFFRFVDVLRPKVIMLENVPGLAKDKRMNEFVLKIQKLGYFVDENSVMICNAADYGVPQRRRRLVFIASMFGVIGRPEKVDVISTVRNAISHLGIAGLSGDPLHDVPERRSDRIKEMIKQIPPDGGSRSDLGDKYQLDCHKKCSGFKDVYGRMSWDNVAPTITGGCVNPSKGRFLHPEENRCITLREAALLQGFPEGYKFSLSRGKFAVAQMIGNALPPGLIKAHSLKVIEHLTENL